MIKNNKGISLVMITMSIIVISIIISTISITAVKGAKMKKIGTLYNDLTTITDKAQIYLLRYNKLPVKDIKYCVSKNYIKEVCEDEQISFFNTVEEIGLDCIFINSNGEFNKENLINPNDITLNSDGIEEAVYYEIDPSLLGKTSLVNSGKYVINENSKTVYYIPGIVIDDEEYNELPIKYKEIAL